MSILKKTIKPRTKIVFNKKLKDTKGKVVSHLGAYAGGMDAFPYQDYRIQPKEIAEVIFVPKKYKKWGYIVKLRLSGIVYWVLWDDVVNNARLK